jgi:hypothetical protein
MTISGTASYSNVASFDRSIRTDSSDFVRIGRSSTATIIRQILPEANEIPDLAGALTRHVLPFD